MSEEAVPPGYQIMERRPDAGTVRDFHTQADTDSDRQAIHHTIGSGVNQAASGSHMHNGADSPMLGTNIEITGAKGGNTALDSVIAAMVQMFGVKDSTT